MADGRSFLTAEWRHLLMLNYEVDPGILGPLVPAGTVLDLWEGRALVSMVGFMFQKTRLLGLPVPFHTRFEEVNLRFYVRRAGDDGEQQRGVVFVRELVPRFWIAQVARWVYGEKYSAVPMRHTLETREGSVCPDGLVEYAWRYHGRLNRLGGLAQGTPRALAPGSEEEFISEHYWGFTRRGAEKKTGAYRVEHPAWLVRSVAQPYLLCDVKALYGAQFEPFLHHRPRSAFLAEGSAVRVQMGKSLRARNTKTRMAA